MGSWNSLFQITLPTSQCQEASCFVVQMASQLLPLGDTVFSSADNVKYRAMGLGLPETIFPQCRLRSRAERKSRQRCPEVTGASGDDRVEASST